jgi:hypothetical protein
MGRQFSALLKPMFELLLTVDFTDATSHLQAMKGYRMIRDIEDRSNGSRFWIICAIH